MGLVSAACYALTLVLAQILSFQGSQLLGRNPAGALGNATQLFAVAFDLLILGNHLSAALLRAKPSARGCSPAFRNRDRGRAAAREELVLLTLPGVKVAGSFAAA